MTRKLPPHAHRSAGPTWQCRRGTTCMSHHLFDKLKRLTVSTAACTVLRSIRSGAGKQAARAQCERGAQLETKRTLQCRELTHGVTLASGRLPGACLERSPAISFYRSDRRPERNIYCNSPPSQSYEATACCLYIAGVTAKLLSSAYMPT